MYFLSSGVNKCSNKGTFLMTGTCMQVRKYEGGKKGGRKEGKNRWIDMDPSIHPLSLLKGLLEKHKSVCNKQKPKQTTE